MRSEFVIAILGMVMIVVVVVVWQVFATARARASVAREDEYRGLSARAVVAEETSSRQLAEVATQLTQVNDRLAKIERMLTVVE